MVDAVRNVGCGMRNQMCRVQCISILATFFATVACAQDARFTTNSKRLTLSESLVATLTIEGPAPLRVELPTQLLDPITERDWKIQPRGTPTVSAIRNNREKWIQTFRLDPYVPGEAMPVIFAAVKVNGREVLPGGFDVKVITTVTDTKAENAKPVTGIEEISPPPVTDTPVSLTKWVVVGLVLVGVVTFGVVRWLRQKPPAVFPKDWAETAFDQLVRSEQTGEALVAGTAAILREFIKRQFGVPATTLTTSELLATPTQPWSVEQANTLTWILERCDRAKFAGDIPDDSGCRDVCARCRQWVHDVSPAVPGPG